MLTGGPGTGKTTTVRTVIRLLEAKGFSYALAAPTGRAAKRLAEATGREAKTIHRLLEFKPQKGFQFQRNEENPLDVDMVIVDEASMLDLLLTNHLLKAIHPESHLLLVGDVDQLPSVGAGNVLRDIIASGVAAVVRLDGDLSPGRGQPHHRERPPHQPGRDAPVSARRRPTFSSSPPRMPSGPPTWWWTWYRTASPAGSASTRWTTSRCCRPCTAGAAGVGELNRRLQAALNPPAAGQGRAPHGARRCSASATG